MFYSCTAACCSGSMFSAATYHAIAKAGAEGGQNRGAERADLKRRPSKKADHPIPTIDIHCHYVSPEVEAVVRPLNIMEKELATRFISQVSREVNHGQFAALAPKLSDLETRIRDMDCMGIDIQTIAPPPFHYFYWAEPDAALSLARQVNDSIAAMCARRPSRFLGLGTVPLQNGKMAAAELTRCVEQLGLRGVEIGSNVNGKNLTDPGLELDVFFAKAEALGAVVLMHPLGFTHGEQLSENYFINVLGVPIDSTIAVAHLIFEGIFERYPGLKLVVAHAGGYLPHYHGRMDHAYEVRPECRKKISQPPSSYLGKVFFDTLAFDARTLRHMIDLWGSKQILLGTDYPYDMGDDDPLGLIGQINGLRDEDRSNIIGGNAARLMGLSFQERGGRENVIQ
jgi:aminocarboxymuconate-semialdehyde decarboxylase